MAWLPAREAHAWCLLLLVAVAGILVASPRVAILNAAPLQPDTAVIDYQVRVPAHAGNRAVALFAFDGDLEVVGTSPQALDDEGPQLVNFPKVRLPRGHLVLVAVLFGEHGVIVARDERRVFVRGRFDEPDVDEP